MRLISLVIPCYNEEESLPFLYPELCKIADKLGKKYSVEVIFINDGSRDNTQKILTELHQRDSRVKVINFSRNFGHQMAVTAGLDYAKGEAVIIMDADMQDPPDVALEMVKKWEDGYEVVYGQRMRRKDETFFKKFTAFLFYRILDMLSEVEIPKDTGDFRLMDKKVVEAVRSFSERNRFIRGIVAYVGFKQTAVLFDRPGSVRSQTHYTLKKMLRLATDAIVGFSTLPLKWIMYAGLGMLLLSLCTFVYVCYFYLSAGVISGNSIILGALFFVSGVQLITLGVLGTYLGRIYSEVQRRPLYIISSVLDSSSV